MTYQPKKQPCNFCKGKAKVRSFSMCISLTGKEPSEETKALAEAMRNDDRCPQCDGAGEVNAPPYNDGSQAKLPEEMMKELANAATLLRCIDDAVLVQAVANQAAKIVLPQEIVDTYVAYWADPNRDATLGEYIMQIAQSAEELALATYGDLGNPIFAGPRPTPV